MPSLRLFSGKKKFAPSAKVKSSAGVDRRDNRPSKYSVLKEEDQTDCYSFRNGKVFDDVIKSTLNHYRKNSKPLEHEDTTSCVTPPTGLEMNNENIIIIRNLGDVECADTREGLASREVFSENMKINDDTTGVGEQGEESEPISDMPDNGYTLHTVIEREHVQVNVIAANKQRSNIGLSKYNGQIVTDTIISDSVLDDYDSAKLKQTGLCTSGHNSKAKEKRSKVRNAKSADLNQNLCDIGKEVDQIQIKDFIYFTPSGAGMCVEQDVDEEVCHSDNVKTAVDTSKDTGDIGPRVMLDANGQLILDQASLLVTSSCHVQSGSKPECEERGKRRVRQNRQWSAARTRAFYRCLNKYGTDLSMIASDLDLPRWQVKYKYSREMKQRLELVHKAHHGNLTEDELIDAITDKKKHNNNSNKVCGVKAVGRKRKT